MVFSARPEANSPDCQKKTCPYRLCPYRRCTLEPTSRKLSWDSHERKANHINHLRLSTQSWNQRNMGIKKHSKKGHLVFVHIIMNRYTYTNLYKDNGIRLTWVTCEPTKSFCHCWNWSECGLSRSMQWSCSQKSVNLDARVSFEYQVPSARVVGLIVESCVTFSTWFD